MERRLQTVTHDSVYVASRKGADLSADQTLAVYRAVKTPLRGHDGEREDGSVWAMCQTESDTSACFHSLPPKKDCGRRVLGQLLVHQALRGGDGASPYPSVRVKNMPSRQNP